MKWAAATIIIITNSVYEGKSCRLADR